MFIMSPIPKDSTFAQSPLAVLLVSTVVYLVYQFEVDYTSSIPGIPGIVVYKCGRKHSKNVFFEYF
jgi:hypothetical protein